MSENLIKLRLYKYDASKSNGLGEEIPNVLIGGKITSCLDDTNDTAEITISNSARKEPYKPLTKFKLALEQPNNTTKYYDYELRYDLVEKLSMANELYSHRLYLGNPAISCQKRTCDNFAISYKLQDVTLESDSFDKTYISTENVYEETTTTSTYNTIYAVYGTKLGEKYENTGVLKDHYRYEESSARYIEWAMKDITTNDGKLDLATTENYYDKLKNTHYWIILDNESDGLTNEMMSKMNTWWKAQSTKVKIQVANWQSGKTYPECFEKCPIVNENGAIDYVIPQLLAYTSYTNGVNIDSGAGSIDKTNYVVLPRKTTVTIVNNDTSEEEITDYYSTWLNTYAEHRDTSSRSRVVIYDETKVHYINSSVNSLIDSDTNNILLYEAKKSVAYSTSDLQTENARVYIKGDNISAGYLTIPSIYASGGKTYTFETTGYFGGAYVPKYIKYSKDSERTLVEEKENSVDFINKIQLKSYKNYSWTYGTSYGYSLQIVDDIQYFANGDDFKFKVSFTILHPNQMISEVILKQPNTKPNCYDLFKKAQICCETKNVIGDKTWGDIDSQMLPYVVDSETKAKMTNKSLIEDTYQNKNLWEIFMQIGKYIHAKPYITFNQNKYQLNFKDYGVSTYSTNKATKNSIYTSNNIENYISSLDSYIQNYFQYGNEVTECIRPTDNDGTCVCSTDNAVLKTRYPILEITSLTFRDFDTGSNATFDLTDYVFEHNIYKILPLHKTIDGTSTGYSHYKGNSIYYHNNSTEIMGLQYKEISTDASEENAYAIKQAIYECLIKKGDTRYKEAKNVKINSFYFIIKYRTKDDVRFKSYKPDLRKFIRNADVDLYPTQSQFNNQLDKTVDSEKYGNNTYGTLLRSGNENKEFQDYVVNIDDLKDSGELYDLGNQYYVSKNTMVIYPTYVACETEYSKDYNKLSEIIGIDSQPRFYEIAESEFIKRNVAIDRFYKIYYGADLSQASDLSMMDMRLLSVCYANPSNRPNYAMVYFKSMSGHNIEAQAFNKSVVVPCIPYMSGNTITYEFDMADNFGAGDWQKNASEEYQDVYYSSSYFAQMLKLFTNVAIKNNSETYTTRQSYQYCDVFGKADLIDFRILHENAVSDTSSEYKQFMEMNIPELNTESAYYQNVMVKKSMGSECDNDKLTSKDYGYIIDKDARECIGINFSCHILTGSDQFIVSNQFWNEKKYTDGTYLDYTKDFYMVYLSKEVDRFTRDEITQNEILYKKQINLNLLMLNGYEAETIDGTLNGDLIEERLPEVYSNVKAIAVAFSIKENNSQMSFLFALNLNDMYLEGIGGIRFGRVRTSDFKLEYED